MTILTLYGLYMSLVMSLMVSYFVLSFFPRDVLDEIWEWIESVPENFPTYFFIRAMYMHSAPDIPCHS